MKQFVGDRDEDFGKCEMDGMIMEMIVEAFPGMVRSVMVTSRAMDGQSTGERRCPLLLDDWWTGNGGASLCTRDNAPAYLPAQLLERSTRVRRGFVSTRAGFCVLGKPLSSGLRVSRSLGRSPGFQAFRSPGLQMLRYVGLVS